VRQFCRAAALYFVACVTRRAAALLQAPLARFGDTAANVGTLALLDDFEATKSLPVAVKTGARSLTRRWVACMPTHMC
jgi:hypothetical protein